MLRVVFSGFEEALSAPVYGHMVACFGTVLLLFLAVSKRRFQHPSTDAWHSPRARILLTFPVSHACPTERWRDHMVACFGTVLLLFLAVSKRRFRHPSTDAWHSPRARILVRFPCLACVPHAALEGMHGGMLWHGPAIVFSGFEEALSAPVYGIALGLGSCWGFRLACVPHGALRDHMVACFGTACPTERLKDHMVACFGTVLLLFLTVSKRRFQHLSRARILLGFPCFACVPHGALEGPYGGMLWHGVPHGALEGPYGGMFGTVLLLFLAVSKRLFRRPSTDAWHNPWARLLLTFPVSHACPTER